MFNEVVGIAEAISVELFLVRLLVSQEGLCSVELVVIYLVK